MNIADNKLLELLKKKAKGYKVKEVSEEFSVVEGEQTLVKRKVSEKHIAPDLSALKLLLEFSLGEGPELTAEQMESEKKRLLKLLRETEEGEKPE